MNEKCYVLFLLECLLLFKQQMCGMVFLFRTEIIMNACGHFSQMIELIGKGSRVTECCFLFSFFSFEKVF